MDDGSGHLLVLALGVGIFAVLFRFVPEGAAKPLIEKLKHLFRRRTR